MDHLHNRKERFIVIVAARRSGKSVASVNHLIRSAMTNPGLYAYIAPYKEQAKKVIWDIFKEYSKDLQPKYNEQQLSITFPNGGKILVLGADNQEALRGLGLKGVILDEVADLKEGVFTKIILPTLATERGYAIFIGTPKGKNLFYQLYMRGQKGEPDWYSVKLNVYEAKNLSEEEIKTQKAEMTDEEFMQEFMCDFTTAIGGAIYKEEVRFLKENNRITKVLYDSRYPVYTFWDIGYTDKTAIIWVQRVNNAYYLIDYYEESNKDTTHYANVIRSKPYGNVKLYLPHDAAHKTLANNGVSFEMQLNDLGFETEIVQAPSNKILAINSTRMKLKMCFIDEDKCEKLIDYLSRYQWKSTLVSERYPVHDDTSHGMDALSYFALTEITDKQGVSGSLYGEDSEIHGVEWLFS